MNSEYLHKAKLVPEMFSDQKMLLFHLCYFVNYLFPRIHISINMHFAVFFFNSTMIT